jgi:hypothetical protein
MLRARSLRVPERAEQAEVLDEFMPLLVKMPALVDVKTPAT